MKRRSAGAEEGNGEMKSLKAGGCRKWNCGVVSAGAAIRYAAEKMVELSTYENGEGFGKAKRARVK